MKFVFFGTPDYVIPILDTLHKTFKNKSGESGVVAVITQKPKPTGRKQILTYSPVDHWAHEKLEKRDTGNVIRKIFHSSRELLASGTEADIGILAAYGEILPNEVLNRFPRGILNIHPSLLPKFRGASPVQATLITGEEAGATIIKLDEKMDHGPIISQFKEEVQDDDTTETLRNRLFENSAGVLSKLLPTYIKGKITPRAQDHKKATFTTLVKKADAFIQPRVISFSIQGRTLYAEWELPFIKSYSLTPSAYSLNRFIRAMQPWPVAWTNVKLKSDQEIKRLRILKAHVESDKLVLKEVQLEGKNPVSWKQFTQAYPDYKFDY